MSQDRSYQIQVEAARALANWKAFFAEQVIIKAMELSQSSDSSGVITLEHFRQAASFAAGLLATTVHHTDSTDDRQEAA